jgi:hypothetical protein
MNKEKITILSLALLLAVFMGCNQDNSSSSQVAVDDQVGIMHNQLLDTVLNDLWKAKVQLYKERGTAAFKSSSTVLRSQKEYVIDVVHASIARASKNMNPEITDETIAVYASKKQLAAYMEYPAVRSGNSVVEEGISLTPFQQKYYEELMRIVHSKNVTLAQLLEQISSLEEKIAKEAPDSSESEPLFYTTSVARHSAQYWAENFSKWKLVFNSEICRIITGNIPKDIAPQTKSNGIATSPSGGDLILDLPPGFYPHPGDVTKFFIVVEGGLAYEFTCPNGLHWNAVKCACDWPEDAEKDNKNFNWSELLGADIGGALGGIKGSWPVAILSGSAASIGNAIGQLF